MRLNSNTDILEHDFDDIEESKQENISVRSKINSRSDRKKNLFTDVVDKKRYVDQTEPW